MARTHLSSAPPVHDELEALAHAYHLLETEVERGGDELEPELLRIHKRFERILEHAVEDDVLRERWHAHLHSRDAVPNEPPRTDPVVFRGESNAGSHAEIRRHGGELDVRVDGEPADGLDDPDELRARRSGLVLRIGDAEFRETFRATLPAIHALAEWSEAGARPPWEHAEELLEDGLVDPHFGITPRGRRAIPAPP
jgi:hypothetical protein